MTDMHQARSFGFYVISLFFRLIGIIPKQWMHIPADFFGTLWFRIDRKHRNITIGNLTRAYGEEMSPDDVQALAKQVFKNVALIPFEIGWYWKLDQQRLRRYFSVRGLLNYRAALAENKGLLILTGHMGNWELMAVGADIARVPLHVVYRPLDFKPLDEFIAACRTRFGTRLIPKSHAMRKILRALKQGEAVGLLIDQSVDWYDGVYVNFFNQMTCTTEGLALLALKTGAPVISVFLVREDGRYIAEFGPEIPLIRTGDRRKDIEENTSLYNRTIEDFIRRSPDQWFWVHNRWKHRPSCPWPKL